MKPVLSALGFVSVVCGIIGLFVPVWPSTIFFIIAVGLFAKSNPAAEEKLLQHPRIGPTLRNWRESRSISRRSKLSASVTIAVMIGISIYFVGPVWLKVGLALVAVALIIFLCTRPEPKASQEDQSRQIV